MNYPTKILIDGELVDGERSLDVINPATGEVFTTVTCASEQQAEQAVQAAKAAQPAWEALGWDKRKEYLIRFADAFAKRIDEVAKIMVLEQGKPFADATAEAQYSEIFVRHFAEMTLPVETIQDDEAAKIQVHRKALGVVVGIAPWNFPLLIPAFKMAPAVLAGNTIVLKAAPSTPMCSMLIGEVAQEVFPAGVVNVIVDQNDLGPFLTSHSDVAKITFTGSTATGKKIMESASGSLKRLTLELGGNDAAIVLGDVDIEDAAEKIFNAAFYLSGQACLCVKRVYVEDSIYDEFCDAIARRANAAIVGDGMEEGSQLGPLQNKDQFEKAKHFLEVAGQDGKIIAGGTVGNAAGNFVHPTIVRDIEDGSELVDQEQFSPVLPIVRVSDAEDALVRANNSPYGLGGSVWSKDRDRARDLASRMQSGTCWINQHLNFGPHIPFAGAKQSGIGVEWTEHGLAEFTQLAVINEAL